MKWRDRSEGLISCFKNFAVILAQTVMLKQTSVTKKKDSGRAMALDSDNNQIQVKDIVKVVDGPHSVSSSCFL